MYLNGIFYACLKKPLVTLQESQKRSEDHAENSPDGDILAMLSNIKPLQS